MVEQIIAFLVFCAGIGGATTALIENFKPLFLDKLQESVSEQVYLLVVYGVRLLASVAGVLMFGGVDTLASIIPFFGTVPPIAPLVVAALIASLDSAVIYTVVDYLELLRTNFKVNGANDEAILDWLDSMTPSEPEKPTPPALG